MKILLAEDDVMTALLMKTIFKKHDHDVVHAKNGCEAIDLFDDYKDYDVVVTDIMMPIKDGCDVIKHIRLEACCDIPIIVQTALGEHEICNDHIRDFNIIKVLRKPVDMDNLITFIDNTFGEVK